ncbi:F-box/WD repeat-containing protein 7 [Magallana gigas]|uniref:F-box/WD repeat-containing protein 7 n=1 Tax=Magallana gigas TaxID=29159 RepID=UPI00333FEFE6
MASKKVDINTATLQDFAQLCGIGVRKAQAIIKYRKAVGGFTTISDLSDVPGLGYGIIEQSRNCLVCTVASKCRLRAAARGRKSRSDVETAENDVSIESPQPSTSTGRALRSRLIETPSTSQSDDSLTLSHGKFDGGSHSEAVRVKKEVEKDDEAEDEEEEEEEEDSSHEENGPQLSDDDVSSPTEIDSAPPSPQENRRLQRVHPPRSRIPVLVGKMKRKSYGCREEVWIPPFKRPCRSDDFDSQSTFGNLKKTTIIPSYAGGHRPRIPSKEHPPPRLMEWLQTFQMWSNAERLMAVDELIQICEPTQVRHMMQVIEPQFQRDFISLLPKELALYVLSFLEPKALLKAAQTCRYWRVLAEDNLLWREKCKEEGITETLVYGSNRLRRRTGSRSPWKALYMRQHQIEQNWRAAELRSPKLLRGHDDHVITCLEFCGSRVVSGSDDNTLKVWSVITGKCLRTLVGHTGGVWSSQMEDNIIISGSTDRTLKVWNADTGQCINTLYGHTSTVRCMHLHKNIVVSGSRDATLRVWDIHSGVCKHVLMGHVAAVRCVQYDGKRVVSGAYDYMVKVWDPETETCIHTLQGHTNRVYSLQFDGVHIVSGSLDTSIRVWDVESGNCLHTLIGHQSLTSGLELKDNILVSGNADSTVKVWDITTGQCLQTLQGPNKHQSAVTCLQFNKKFVITSSDDGTVKIWDLKSGDFLRNLVSLDSGGSGGVVWRVRCSNTKLVCAVGSRNGTEETKLLVLDFDVEDKKT